MPILHPQPEDAPCRGDRDPLVTASNYACYSKSRIIWSRFFPLSITWQHRNPPSTSVRNGRCHSPYTQHQRNRTEIYESLHHISSIAGILCMTTWQSDTDSKLLRFGWQKTKNGYNSVAAKLYLNALTGSPSSATSWKTLFYTSPQKANILIPNFVFSNIQLRLGKGPSHSKFELCTY